MEIFAVKRSIVSEIIKVLLNDIFAELDGSNGIKNTDRLNRFSGLQVDDQAITKNYGRKYEEIIPMR